VMFVAPAPAPASAGKAKRGKKGEAKKGEAKKIEKIEDLAGRHLTVVGRSPANINLLKIILQQSGIPPEKVEVVQIDTTDVGTKIRDSKADAIMLVGPVGSKISTEAVAAASRGKEAPTF